MRSSTMALVMVLTALSLSRAEMMPPLYDSELAGRDLVLVGRMDPASLKQGDNESTATLIVEEVLKGTPPDRTLPVRLRVPVVVGGRYKGANITVDVRDGRADYPKDRIVLVDRGDFSPAQVDLSGSALWFLQKREGLCEVSRAGHVQALKFKPFFASVLAGTFDRQVEALLRDKDVDIRLRVLTYLKELHREGDVAYVAPLLKDESDALQAAAANTAAEIGAIGTVPFFREALTHRNPKVRAAACAFLCRFNDVDSLPGVARALPGMNYLEVGRVARALGRVQSPRVIPILLDVLDYDGTVEGSVADIAAQSLRAVTGAYFPLDAQEARRLCGALEGHPPAAVLRKAILTDIEHLTHPDYEIRWEAFRRLGKVVNRHFGDYNAFHSFFENASGREESQRLWRTWAAENLTRSRLDWIYDGFKASGIDLPRPMTKEGIDTVIEVLRYYYLSWPADTKEPTIRWVKRGWSHADFHAYNANLLLERYTGHTVGLSPYDHDLEMTWKKGDILPRRWADWWREHRAAAVLREWPVEAPVTREMVERVPDLGPPPDPLAVTIRLDKEVFKKDEKVVVHVTLENTSSHQVTIAERPRNIQYHSRTGSGAAGHYERSGTKKEEFVTLKPGESIEWDETAAFGSSGHPIEDLQYRLHYPFRGKVFGLRGWRGILRSNAITYRFQD